MGLIIICRTVHTARHRHQHRCRHRQRCNGLQTHFVGVGNGVGNSVGVGIGQCEHTIKIYPREVRFTAHEPPKWNSSLLYLFFFYPFWWSFVKGKKSFSVCNWMQCLQISFRSCVVPHLCTCTYYGIGGSNGGGGYGRPPLGLTPFIFM